MPSSRLRTAVGTPARIWKRSPTQALSPFLAELQSCPRAQRRWPAAAYTWAFVSWGRHHSQFLHPEIHPQRCGGKSEIKVVVGLCSLWRLQMGVGGRGWVSFLPLPAPDVSFTCGCIPPISASVFMWLLCIYVFSPVSQKDTVTGCRRLSSQDP